MSININPHEYSRPTPLPAISYMTEPRDSDDENSFVPPALSAYSLALLENSLNNHSDSLEEDKRAVTGIYELDFPQKPSNPSFKGVHFNEPYVQPMMESKSLNKQYSQNHNNSLNLSDIHSSGYLDDFDFMDVSPDRNKIATQTPATPNTFSNTNTNKSSEGSLNTVRSIRGTRRIGKLSLGPPKRASRRSDESTNSESSNHVITGHETPSYHEPDSNSNIFQASKFNTPPPSFHSETLQELEKSREIEEIKNEHKQNLRAEISSLEHRKQDTNNSFSGSNDDYSAIQSHHEMKQNNSFSSHRNLKNESLESSIKSNKENIFNFETSRESHFEAKKFSIPKRPSMDVKESLRRPLSLISPNIATNPSEFKRPQRPMPPVYHKSPATISAPVDQNPQVQTHMSGNSLADVKSTKKGTVLINNTQYEKLELLGRGGTSKVYKVKSLTNHKVYAMKRVTFDQFDQSCIKGFKGEIDLLLRLKETERVVKLIDYSVGDGAIYLVMECGDIDLAHVLNNRANLPMDINFVRFHAIEMLKCLSEVHKAGIVHSDLKPANFLFVRGVLKIIDFGIANAVPDHTANIYRESQIGTPNYMAPEALVEVTPGYTGLPNTYNFGAQSNSNTWKVGRPSDVWSCGCIIYQMIYGRPPYGGYSGNQRIMAIMNPQVKIAYPERGVGDVIVPKSAIETIQKCLDRDPSRRWTVEQVLDGPFLNPKMISEDFITDLVHSAVNFGISQRQVSIDVYDKLVETVLKQIDDLHY